MKPEKEISDPEARWLRRLKSFQAAQLIYDVTVRFCDRYIERRSRTHDQVVQPARNRVQNIVEGSQPAGTSKKTELKLTKCGVLGAGFLFSAFPRNSAIIRGTIPIGL